MKPKKKEETENKEKEPAKPEPTFEILNNPSRVTPSQRSVISFDVDPRYVPVSAAEYGIVLLKDTKPEEKEELLEMNKTSAVTVDNEPEAPEPFEFLG